MSRDVVDFDRPYFDSRDIADVLGTSTNYVREQVKAGKLTAVVNRKWNSRTLLRFSLNDVIHYDRDAGDRLMRNLLRRTEPAA